MGLNQRYLAYYPLQLLQNFDIAVEIDVGNLIHYLEADWTVLLEKFPKGLGLD